jgi:hypothetical protein
MGIGVFHPRVGLPAEGDHQHVSRARTARARRSCDRRGIEHGISERTRAMIRHSQPLFLSLGIAAIAIVALALVVMPKMADPTIIGPQDASCSSRRRSPRRPASTRPRSTWARASPPAAAAGRCRGSSTTRPATSPPATRRTRSRSRTARTTRPGHRPQRARRRRAGHRRRAGRARSRSAQRSAALRPPGRDAGRHDAEHHRTSRTCSRSIRLSKRRFASYELETGGDSFATFLQQVILDVLYGGSLGITATAGEVDALAKNGGAFAWNGVTQSLNFVYGAGRFHNGKTMVSVSAGYAGAVGVVDELRRGRPRRHGQQQHDGVHQRADAALHRRHRRSTISTVTNAKPLMT